MKFKEAWRALKKSLSSSRKEREVHTQCTDTDDLVAARSSPSSSSDASNASSSRSSSQQQGALPPKLFRTSEDGSLASLTRSSFTRSSAGASIKKVPRSECLPFAANSVVGQRSAMEDSWAAIPGLLVLPRGMLTEPGDRLPPKIGLRTPFTTESGVPPAPAEQPPAPEQQAAAETPEPPAPPGAADAAAGATEAGAVPTTVETAAAAAACVPVPVPLAPGPVHFFGVYDGHGGPDVSKQCAKRMHEHLRDLLPPEFSAGANYTLHRPSLTRSSAGPGTPPMLTPRVSVDPLIALAGRASNAVGSAVNVVLPTKTTSKSRLAIDSSQANTPGTLSPQSSLGKQDAQAARDVAAELQEAAAAAVAAASLASLQQRLRHRQAAGEQQAQRPPPADGAPVRGDTDRDKSLRSGPLATAEEPSLSTSSTARSLDPAVSDPGSAAMGDVLSTSAEGSDASTQPAEAERAGSAAVAVGAASGGPQPLTSRVLEEALVKAFVRMDNNLGAAKVAREEGSTAVVSLISPTHLWVANCGDSRAILCRQDETLAMSLDHKANRNDEVERVEQAGGYIWWDRVMGELAVSRAIGDHCLRPYVIAEPEVTRVTRKPDDQLLVLATDGLWDVFSNEDAAKLALEKFQAELSRGADCSKAAAKTASLLVKAAISKGTKDNVTVLVVDVRLLADQVSIPEEKSVHVGRHTPHPAPAVEAYIASLAAAGAAPGGVNTTHNVASPAASAPAPAVGGQQSRDGRPPLAPVHVSPRQAS